MRFYENRELPSGNTVFTFILELSDGLPYIPDEFDRGLARECAESPSIADKLLILERIARRIEEGRA